MTPMALYLTHSHKTMYVANRATNEKTTRGEN